MFRFKLFDIVFSGTLQDVLYLLTCHSSTLEGINRNLVNCHWRVNPRRIIYYISNQADEYHQQLPNIIIMFIMFTNFLNIYLLILSTWLTRLKIQFKAFEQKVFLVDVDPFYQNQTISVHFVCNLHTGFCEKR